MKRRGGGGGVHCAHAGAHLGHVSGCDVESAASPGRRTSISRFWAYVDVLKLAG